MIAAAAHYPTPALTAMPRTSLRRVLIVEDQPQMRKTMVGQVETFGATVFQAATSYEAIRIAGEERPDVILIDALLPQMHGFELARFIRAMDRDYWPRIAIITSIYKKVHYRNEAKLKYGIDHYLFKPLEASALAEVLT